jgi:Cu-Zn family superoxide dismutase
MDIENQAICVLNFVYNTNHTSKGIAYFYKTYSVVDNRPKEVTNLIIMLKDVTLEYGNLKGLHIHECGDVTDGCQSACAHYNPNNNNHGGLNSKVRHYGDLGNVKIDNTGFAIIHLENIPIDITHIVGRSLVIHEAEDDLGLGKQRYNIDREEISRTILKYLNKSNRKICYYIMSKHQLVAKQLEDKIGNKLTALRRWDQSPTQLEKLVKDTMVFRGEKIVESKKTGNSGSRIACGIIGYCKPKNIELMLRQFSQS